MKQTKHKEIKLLPIQIIPASFLLAIAVGTILLMLPIASVQGARTTLVTALFTATTSVCVTGLVVVDTYAHWSFFGQAVILLLIQIGGLGMIAMASTLMILIRKKFSLTDRILLRDALNLNTNSRLLTFLVNVLKGTFLVEGIGAMLYAVEFVPAYGWKRGLWFSLFHSVSAFCNAGMDIIGMNSLGNYRSNPLVLSVTIVLIILGGLGFIVWFDLLGRAKEGIQKKFGPRTVFGRLSEHSKLVLVATGALLVLGTILFLFMEYDNPGTIGNMSFPGKVANSFFESVTLRTAGFTTFPQENLRKASCIVAYLFMFIGGSPIGTAGGIKTITFFLLLLNVHSYLRNQEDKVLFHHRVSEEAMRKASAIVFVSAMAVLTLSTMLLLVNPVPLEDALYEVISACGTVGLSRGLTSSLNTTGRLIIILAMYLGRIGPISLVALFSADRGEGSKIKHSEGIFYVG